jgi:hypothetical protein
VPKTAPAPCHNRREDGCLRLTYESQRPVTKHLPIMCLCAEMYPGNINLTCFKAELKTRLANAREAR